MFNIYLYYYARKLFQVFPFLLPHEKDYLGLAQLLNAPDGLFLDIGANDGVSARSFNKIRPGYAIFSIEPNPMHGPSLKRLKRKFRRFDFRLCAVGDESGSVTLTVPFRRGIPLHSASFCIPEQRAVLEAVFPAHIARQIKYRTQDVPVVRVDDLHLAPTVVKVDAEGYDSKIIRGMAETIRRYRPILMIENNRLTLGEITTFLTPFGYVLREYDHNKRQFGPYSGRPTRNVFFVQRGSNAHLSAGT